MTVTEPPAPEGVRIAAFLSQPFEQWAYVLGRQQSAEVLVIDPGLRVDHMLAYLDEQSLNPVAILNTHGHYDHIAGNAKLKRRAPEAPLLIGRNEAKLLSEPELNLSGLFGVPMTSPPADRTLGDGERCELAGFAFEVREIPGHSPGSIVLVAEEERPPFVIGGDVLFRGSIGRFDFPGGDERQLLAGIRERLLPLPDETLIYPGHGPTTTIGTERRSNPCLTGGRLV